MKIIRPSNKKREAGRSERRKVAEAAGLSRVQAWPSRPQVNRKFHPEPSRILAIRARLDWIAAVDAHMAEYHREMCRNRSEFIRRSVEEKIARERGSV